MNSKETAEIRKRFSFEKTNVTHIRGCFVNDKKEMTSSFDLPLGLMYRDEAEKLLAIFKKALTGRNGRNLLDISFTNNQVLDSDEHRMLTRLRKDGEDTQSALGTLYSKIIANYDFPDSYVILIASDSYDIPKMKGDPKRAGEDEDSIEMFSFIVCAICPLRLTRAELRYDAPDNRFASVRPDSVLCPPDVAFMFPAFTDRRTDIYNALYYTKSTKDNHPELTRGLFNIELQMPAAAQKATFCSMLSDTLAENCSLELVKELRAEVKDMIDEHKNSRESDTLTLRGATIGKILEDLEVPKEQVKAFTDSFEEQFGDNAEIIPENLISQKKLELRSPDVVIKVNPDRPELVSERIIDGQRYILIRANEGVELNGVSLKSPEE